MSRVLRLAGGSTKSYGILAEDLPTWKISGDAGASRRRHRIRRSCVACPDRHYSAACMTKLCNSRHFLENRRLHRLRHRPSSQLQLPTSFANDLIAVRLHEIRYSLVRCCVMIVACKRRLTLFAPVTFPLALSPERRSSRMSIRRCTNSPDLRTTGEQVCKQ